MSQDPFQEREAETDANPIPEPGIYPRTFNET